MVAGARDLCTALLRDCEPYGCFRWREQPLPNLLYLNDVVMLCWVIDDLPADPELRARWAATLNRFQYPEGGAYWYPPFAQPSWQHATMNTVIALNMLGARPACPLAMLEPLRDIDTCRRWVESHADPLTAVPHHRYGLGAVLMHSSPPPPPGWADAFLSAIRRLQDPASGLFPRSLSESWSRDYEVSEPRGPPRRPPGSVAHSRVPKQGLREGLRLFGRDRDASNTLQRVSGARSGATARPPGPTDPSYPPARAYSRFRFHAVHTRLHSPSAPRNPRR